MENRLPSPLRAYHDRLTVARCNRSSRRDDLVTCNLPHCDLLAILLNRLHGEGSFDHALLMRLRAFVQQKDERTKHTTECRTCIEVHDVMHQWGDAAKGNTITSNAPTGFSMGMGLGIGMAMSGKRGLDEALSPHAMVAHASYTRAAEARHGVVTPLADYQSLQEALQQKRQQLETFSAARAQHQHQQQHQQQTSHAPPFARSAPRADAAAAAGSDNTDLVYALRILDKMIDDVAAAANACTTLRDYRCERCAAAAGKKRQRIR